MVYEYQNKRIPEWGIASMYWLCTVGGMAFIFGYITNFLPALLMGIPTLALLCTLPNITKTYWI